MCRMDLFVMIFRSHRSWALLTSRSIVSSAIISSSTSRFRAPNYRRFTKLPLLCEICQRNVRYLTSAVLALRASSSAGGKIPGAFEGTSESYGHQSEERDIPSDRQIERVFTEPFVQEGLYKIMSADTSLGEIFHPIKSLESSNHGNQMFTRLMSTEELEQVYRDYEQESMHRLQMHPVMNARDDEHSRLLTREDALDQCMEFKCIFADISPGQKHKDRHIVVRETDGSLRTAKPSERDRLLTLLFPRSNRQAVIPKMFLEPQLQQCIDRKLYLNLLHRSCSQFEPDDPQFIRAVNRIYFAVDECQDYDILEGTRFSGNLVFYLLWNNTIDGILLHWMLNERYMKAKRLVELYFHLHQPDTLKRIEEDNLTKEYIRNYAISNKSELSSFFPVDN